MNGIDAMDEEGRRRQEQEHEHVEQQQQHQQHQERHGASSSATSSSGTSHSIERINSMMNISISLSDGTVRAIFLLLGCGILLPWNAFVSAKPYFASRLCGDDGTDIVNFEQYFGLVWNTSSVMSLAIIIFGQGLSDYCKKRIQQQRSSSSSRTNNDNQMKQQLQ